MFSMYELAVNCKRTLVVSPVAEYVRWFTQNDELHHIIMCFIILGLIGFTVHAFIFHKLLPR